MFAPTPKTPTPNRFKGKVVIVTGGSSGLGLSTASRLSEEGAKLVIVGRTEEKLQKAAAEIKEKTGGEVKTVAADVSTKESNDKMVQEALDAFGQVDAAFLNAGGGPFNMIADLTGEEFDESFAVNTKSVLFGIQSVVAAMKEKGTQGNILATSSILSTSVSTCLPPAGVYSMSKAAVDILVKFSAAEFASDGIRVNGISPGYVSTPIQGPDNTDEKSDEFAADKQLVGRAGRPDEIAALASFIMSDEASFVTGSNMVADGGWAIKAY
eukprot:jgi/Ulvmu1/9849/UM057_0002.1